MGVNQCRNRPNSDAVPTDILTWCWGLPQHHVTEADAVPDEAQRRDCNSAIENQQKLPRAGSVGLVAGSRNDVRDPPVYQYRR